MASTLGGGAPPRGRLWSKAPPLGHPIRPPGRACGRFQAPAVCAQPVRLRRPGFYRKSRRQARSRLPARPVVGRCGASGASGGPCCIAALPVVLRGRSGLAAGFAARPSRRLRGSPPPPLPHPQDAAQGSRRAARGTPPLRCARGRGWPCLSGAKRLPWRGPPPPPSAAAPPQAGARKAAQGRCPCRGLSWGRNAPPLAWGCSPCHPATQVLRCPAGAPFTPLPSPLAPWGGKGGSAGLTGRIATNAQFVQSCPLRRGRRRALHKSRFLLDTRPDRPPHSPPKLNKTCIILFNNRPAQNGPTPCLPGSGGPVISLTSQRLRRAPCL